MLLLRILASVDVVQEEVIHAWFTVKSFNKFPAREGSSTILPSRSIFLKLLLIVRLILLLLVAAVAAEDYFVLNHARVSLEMRQSAALTERPLRDVVDVSLHQCQVFPTEAKATCLSPNITFFSRMSDLAR